MDKKNLCCRTPLHHKRRQPPRATARWRSLRVAPEGAAGSRRERNSDVEVTHCRSIEMLGSLVVLCDYRPTRKQENVRGRRLALGTTALRSPPLHPEDRLQRASLLAFYKKTRVLRRSGVIERSPSLIFLKSKRTTPQIYSL